MAQLLVHLITVTLCGQGQPPSPKTLRVVSPVNGCLSGALHQQEVGMGRWGQRQPPARGQRKLPVQLSLAPGETAWTGTGQPWEPWVSPKPLTLSSLAAPWTGRDSLGLTDFLPWLASCPSNFLGGATSLLQFTHGTERAAWASGPLLLLFQLSTAFLNNAGVMVKLGSPGNP